MASWALLFTISCIGISETSYLIKKRFLSERPICPIGENCSLVLESKYSKFLNIHNDVLGLLFYITCSVISAFIVIGVSPINTWLFLFKILLFFGSVISIFLTYIQFKIIKAWCFWCLMSAATIWLMQFIIILD